MNEKKKDTTTDFFLKYVKSENKKTSERRERQEEIEHARNRTFDFFGKLYNNFNQILDKMLASKQSVLIISLILALILFVTMSGGDVMNSTTSGTTIKDVTVEVEGLEDNYEVTGLPASVTVMLVGPSVDIYTTQLTKNYQVYADLSDYSEGTHTVTFKTRNFDEDLDISVVPESATVNISPKVSRKFDLQSTFINEDQLNEKYSVSVTSLSRDTVTLTASKATLDTVDRVVAEIDVADANSSFSQKCDIKAYDADDNEVNCTISPSKVTANCKVDTYSKVVAVKPNFKGKLKKGYTMTNYKLSPSTVTIYGKRSDISDINYISCDVNIKGLSGSTTLSGLELDTNSKISKMSSTEIEITMTIEKKGD